MKTQAEKLLHHLRRRPMTYMELISLGISVCPWRRLSPDEVEPHLRPGEKISRKLNGRGLVTLRVVRG
jgi:hypothetical protein